ncbi:MAG: DUF4433 domain-containing protein [Chloroflexi bacterium]|nr:DUF4433 domain-containing protein [Chloroflexota bacterium]
MGRAPINQLYYITHKDNVPSILQRGIMSHEMIVSENIPFTPIYDAQIVKKRHDMKVPDGRSLWSFANVYFQVRNAMLYRVIFFSESTGLNDIVVLAVGANILNRNDIFISTGNAASQYSDILHITKGRKLISQIRRATDKEWWKDVDGSKREMMAECLVPEIIPPEFVRTIYVASHNAANTVKTTLDQLKLIATPEVVPEPKMFFQPSRKETLTPRLAVIDGDMFFSRMHTLTVSVNCVGVMGKGLASRVKYQFPDVYVFYQDSCRSYGLQMGKPVLYKREASLDYELADEPSTLTNANLETWFLLFATKQHWRQRADIQGIEKGLQWLVDNYEKEGIKSLAIPALGCGLGRLDWHDVGPLMCKYLRTLDIPVEIYLPAERKVPDELTSKGFLLR